MQARKERERRNLRKRRRKRKSTWRWSKHPLPSWCAVLSFFPLAACYTERLTTATTVQEMLKGVRYGFNNQYSGLFSQIQEEVRSLFHKLYAQLLSAPDRPGPLQRCASLTFAFRLQTSEIVELPCPDTTPASERRELRILTEDDKFDPEHYMYVAIDCDTRHTAHPDLH